MSIDKLVNKKITSFTKDDRYITFETTEGKLSYYAEADCCSSSYIEDMDNPEALINSTVINVDVVSGEVEGEKDYNVIKWTFYKFLTDKGMCTLSFRNESNGYYNGWLKLVND